MGLELGTKLGPYEVIAPLGAGGMAEVWRAVDARLGRDVALKVLPDDIAHGTEHHARFDREAKLLASLNHPNIATLYGVEHVGGDDRLAHVLVMELVEGEGLEERIARGPLPPDEAVPIALQVAAALVAAHESGIVHRDLKPANVRIRPDGTAKVLDFGLAKAWQEDSRPRDISKSPTITFHHSMAGAIIGTASYMAPEQARGRAVDHRVDIWAFGCLLFEMLTGEHAFDGDTVSDTIAAILKEQPRWELLPRGLDPALRRVLRRCLAKEPSLRYQHLADACLELLEYRDQAAEAITAGPASGRFRPSRTWLAGIAGAAVLLLGLLTLTAIRRPAAPEPPTYRPLTFRSAHVSSARFAGDDETVVFAMSTGDRPLSLYSTHTGSIESRLLDLPGADVLGIADNGRMVVLLDSHREGSWIRVGTLAETDLAGGAPRSLVERANGGAISPDGKAIAVVHEAGPGQRLEYPLGEVLFETEGWISHVAISPDGRRVAFIHHPFYGDDRGLPMVVGPDGQARMLGHESANSMQGLAWSADGEAVLYTEYDFERGGVLWSARPGEEPEALLRTPAAVRLQDVAADGRILLISGDTRAEVNGLLAGQDHERRYEGWNDDSIGGLAADGSLFAGNQQQSNAEGEYTAYVRAADGRPPVLLGLGEVAGMSPGGRWAMLQRMTRDRDKVELFPTGPGRPLTIDLGGVVPVSTGVAPLTSSADGRRVAFTGRGPDGRLRPYVLDLEGRALDSLDSGLGAPAVLDSSLVSVRPIGPEGTRAVVLSPDGTRVAALAPDGTVVVLPVDGGEAVPVPGIAAGEIPLQWSEDGQAVLVWNRTFPAGIDRVSVADGARERALEIMPDDPVGVLYGQIILAPGGEHYLYRFRRDLSVLFLVEGVRGG